MQVSSSMDFEGYWNMLYDLLWLGLTRKGEVAIMSGHELYCRSN